MGRGRNRRLLVTGGAGFIGANFVHYWLKKNSSDRVVVYDALTYAGNRSSLDSCQGNSQFRFVEGDICDTEKVEALMREEAINTLIHFAAESHVDRSILGPDAFIQTNIVGTHSLLKAARAVWLEGVEHREDHRFHHVSTDEVFGSLENTAPAFTEEHPYKPNSPYAASKAGSDHLVRAYHHTYGLRVTTSNCSNNYGPYHFPEKLIPLALINILQGRAVPVYGDGLNIRDWLFVEDHCRGIELVIHEGHVGETYNVGGRCEKTNIDVVQILCGLVDRMFEGNPALAKQFPKAPTVNGKPSTSLIQYVKDRPGHDRRYAIDASKICNELGYEPQESFESGLQKTVQWYLDNESWWRAVMDGSYRNWIETQYD